MLNTVLLLIAQYDNYSPNHSKMSGSFILSFKPFLGRLIILNIKKANKIFRLSERLQITLKFIFQNF